MADIAELKAFIQQNYGEVVDDMIDNFDFIVRRALSMYNRWNPRINQFRIYFSTQTFQFSQPFPRWCTISSADNIPDKLIWSADLLYEYDKTSGTLTINSVGVFMVRAGYNKTIADINIDDDEDFTDLVYALYMIASGNRRKAYRAGDIPFDSDGSDRVSEGKDLLEKAMEALRESAPVWAFVQ